MGWAGGIVTWGIPKGKSPCASRGGAQARVLTHTYKVLGVLTKLHMPTKAPAGSGHGGLAGALAASATGEGAIACACARHGCSRSARTTAELWL